MIFDGFLTMLKIFPRFLKILTLFGQVWLGLQPQVQPDMVPRVVGKTTQGTWGARGSLFAFQFPGWSWPGANRDRPWPAMHPRHFRTQGAFAPRDIFFFVVKS